jgi:hypothetical protein
VNEFSKLRSPVEMILGCLPAIDSHVDAHLLIQSEIINGIGKCPWIVRVNAHPTLMTVDISVASLSDNKIRISMHDVGLGIAQQDVGKIFQPFYRVPNVPKHTKGTGLGLAIAKFLVELHHGQLWVETVPTQGTFFSFTLCSTEPAKLFSTESLFSTHPNHQTTRCWTVTRGADLGDFQYGLRIHAEGL